MRPPHEAPSQPTPSAADGESPPTFLTSPPAAELPTCDVPPADTEAPAAAAPSLPAPTGRYQLGEEIGRGGMGAVLRAFDPELGRELAVKVLLDRHRHDPSLVRRFLEEAGCDQPDLLAHLRGPGPHVRGCWAVDLLLGKG